KASADMEVSSPVRVSSPFATVKVLSPRKSALSKSDTSTFCPNRLVGIIKAKNTHTFIRPGIYEGTDFIWHRQARWFGKIGSDMGVSGLRKVTRGYASAYHRFLSLG